MKEKVLSATASAETGQALIILIVATAVALSILVAALVVSIDLAKITAKNISGRQVYYAAETGAEYSLLKLMRDPASCTGNEVLAINSIVVTINYTPPTPPDTNCTITSSATANNILKKIQVQGSYQPNQVFTFSLWQEIQ